MVLTELSIEELAAHETALREERRRRADELRATASRIVITAREALEAAETEAQELEAQAEALDGKVSAPVRKDEVDELAAELESIPIDEAPRSKRGRKPKGKKPARKTAKRVKGPKAVKASKEPGELNEYEQKIIKAISKGALGTAAIAEKCGLEQPYTARALKKLVGLGLVAKLGYKRATRYEAA